LSQSSTAFFAIAQAIGRRRCEHPSVVINKPSSFSAWSDFNARWKSSDRFLVLANVEMASREIARRGNRLDGSCVSTWLKASIDLRGWPPIRNTSPAAQKFRLIGRQWHKASKPSMLIDVLGGRQQFGSHQMGLKQLRLPTNDFLDVLQGVIGFHRADSRR